MADKKLIMFDFDGVLVDTLGICHALDSETNPDISLAEYRNYFDGNVFETTNEHVQNGTRSFYPVEVFDKKYEDQTRTLTIPDELKMLVAHLAKGAILAIVSSTPSSSILGILEREGLAEYFSDLMGSDIDTSKVVKIKKLLEQYQKKGEETLFITDTVGDIKEARTCDVPAIAVAWGFHEKERLEKLAPFAVAETVPDLAEAVLKFFPTL